MGLSKALDGAFGKRKHRMSFEEGVSGDGPRSFGREAAQPEQPRVKPTAGWRKNGATRRVERGFFRPRVSSAAIHVVSLRDDRGAGPRHLAIIPPIIIGT